MAIFLFIFGALCGLVTAMLSAMLFDASLFVIAAVFFTTCYGVALLPLVLDAMFRQKER